MLLTAATMFAQTPAFNLQGSGTNTTSVTLVRDNPAPVSVASTSSPTQITYSATTSYSADSTNPSQVKWLCLNPSPSGAINGSCDNYTGLVTPDTLNIQIGQNANSTLLPFGQHSAVVTLHATDSSGAPDATITVYYTTGNSTAGTLTASPSSVSTSVAYLGSTTVSFQLTSSSPTPISYNLVNPGVPWITSFITNTGLTAGTVSAGNPATVNVTLNGYNQAQTTLNTTLQVSYSGGTLSIPVTFGNGVTVTSSGGGSGTLSATQTTVNWSYTSGGNFPPNTFTNVSSTSGAVGFGLTFAPANSWFTATANSTSLPTQITVYPTTNIGSLATGTYTGYVYVNATDGSQLAIQVNLTVNGGVSNGLSVSPNPIQLSAALNSTGQVSQTVTVTSNVGGTITASITGTGLSVSVSNSTSIANQPTAAITVSGNPTGLGNGTYIGTLTVNVGGVSQAVQVNFIVGNGGTGTGGSGTGTGSIAAAPSSMTFVYQSNSTMQVFQQQQVFLAGSGSYTASVTTQNGGSNWLQASSTSGTLPAQYFYIDANASGLASGTYTGAVTFTNTTTGTTAVVSVTLTVIGSVGLYTTPNDLVFSYIAGTTSANQFQDINLLATDGSSIPAAAAVTNPGATPWLTISNGTPNTGQSDVYAVTINASNLANGLYTGSLTFTSGSAANSPLIVPVVLNVTGSNVSGGSGGTGALTLGQSSLTFTPAVGGAAQTQQLSVSASTTTNFTASATTQSGGSWLSISPAGSSSTNTTITVTANPAGLSAGTYTGTISLATNSGTQTVNVTMVVGGSSSGGSGNLSVSVNGGSITSSPSLSFTANAVGATPSPQYITVSSASGSSGVSFTETLTGTSCGWVTGTTNSTYTTPVSLNVGASTTGLAGGSYNCNLVLTPTGGTAVTIPLTLTLNTAPTISLGNSTPLTFTYGGGSAPASQTITVNGSSSTAAAFTATATSTGNWLSVTPTSGTASSSAPATLTVSVNPTGLAAGTYNGSISLAAGSGASGSATLNVTLTVTVTSPNITSIVNGASFIGGAVAPGEFVSLLGTNLGPLTPLGPSVTSAGTIATTQGQVQVLFGATPAALTYVSSTQINCTVPYEVNGLSTIAVKVVYQGNSSNVMNLNVTNSAPGIFSATGTGTGQGAILNQNNTLNTGGNPAAKGSVIQIFMTGEGITSPPGADGAITANATTVPVLPIAVKIGGNPATVMFEGEAPGIVAGVLQVNVMVPPNTPSGAQAVVVTIGNNSSQANLTVSVQ